MIAAHPDGTLFVSGYGSQVTGTDWTQPPPLWRSDDGGENWGRLDVGASTDGAQGNSDVDLTVGPDGTLYFITMGYNRQTSEGTHVAMGVSHDRGESWSWRFLSNDRFDDRPWVKVDESNTAHAIWNDGSGVSHAISRDVGESWVEQARIHATGGSSHLAVGPDGRVAVRVSAISASANRFDPEADVIAVSLDHGANWATKAVPGDVEWDPTFSDPDKISRWVEPLAWTPDGMLHHVWSEGDTLKLGTSGDNGESWEIEVISGEPGTAFYPYMESNGGDLLAVTWFSRNGGSLTARLAVIDLKKSDAARRIRLSEPFTPQSWLEDAENKTLNPAGEYLPVIFLQDGDLAVVSPIQDIHDDRWGFSFWRWRMLP